MSCRIKICCIASVEEAELAMAAGADALGLVSRMPSGPGVIGDAAIGAIIEHVGTRADTFLLTSEVEAPRLVAQLGKAGPSTVQLVDAVDPCVYGELREAFPGLRLVQVLHVEGEGAVDEARRLGSLVDALLLDSGRPGAAIKELGGTGRVHDWDISRAVVAEAASVGCPVYLAGGLNAANVARAIETVMPYGVDLCSGVRTGGRLDASKLTAFISAVKSAAGTGTVMAAAADPS